MWMQIAVGAGWLVWLSSGTAGLEKGFTVGALLVLGLGMKNILDTFWTKKMAERTVAGASVEASEPFHFLTSKRRYSSSPALNSEQKSDTSPVLKGFERKYAGRQA